MSRCVIVDIDGTIADNSHRLPLIKQEPKDWQAFHDGCEQDSPIGQVLVIVDLLRQHQGDKIILLTGRPETHREHTERWLERHGVSYSFLIMRIEGDRRPDHVYKSEVLDELLESGYRPWLAIEDSPSVVKMWRERGVFCLQTDDRSWHA